MFGDPCADLVVRGAGGHVIAESVCFDAATAEKALIERTGELVVTIQADEGGAAFIEGAGGKFVTGEPLVWRARFAEAEIRG